MLTHTLCFLSWNVRGLGHADRCRDVLCDLITHRPTFVALQETKLSSVASQKSKTFLPSRLANFVAKPSLGAAGGILSAWDTSVYSPTSSVVRTYSLTTQLVLNKDGSPFAVTNVYAPTAHDDKPAFLAELADIAATIDEPWLILGDFNLTREPQDKNNDNFNHVEAHLFYDTINTLELLEIPLVDRAFTWSNKRDSPILARLDRCFVNLKWDVFFPNTSLTSLTRAASDHVPLLLQATTRIPKSQVFRFENAWLHHLPFKGMISNAIDVPASGSTNKNFVRMLKRCRNVCRYWAKSVRSVDQRETDTNFD